MSSTTRTSALVDDRAPFPTHTAGRTSFRDLARAQDPAFLLLGLAGRLPNAMLPLGLLIYVSDRTGSFGTGGLAVAALSVGGAVGGPLVGTAADRFGHRRVALLACAAGVHAVVAFLLLTRTAESLPLVLGLAGLVGLGNPQVGAMARSRWADVARRREDRGSFTSTAMAYEGAIDETSFVLGPVLVTTLAGLVSPTAGLLAAVAIATVAQTGFALHASALPGRGPAPAVRVAREPLPVGFLVSLLLAMVAVGVVFGSSQTGIAARLASDGSYELTGPVYAVLGLGSAVAGLLTTRLPARVTLPRRIVAGGVLLVLGGVALAVAGHLVALALAGLIVGLGVAPVLVSCYSLAERAAPAGWLATMMTALATANVSGVALGAAIGGQLIDRSSPAAALLVVSVAGVLVSLAGRAAGRRTPGTAAR